MQRQGVQGEENGAAHRQGPFHVWSDLCWEAHMLQHIPTQEQITSCSSPCTSSSSSSCSCSHWFAKRWDSRGQLFNLDQSLCTSLLQQTLPGIVSFPCLPQFSTWLSELGIFLGLQMWCKILPTVYRFFLSFTCYCIDGHSQKSSKSWNN
jgi:hypothetical protein